MPEAVPIRFCAALNGVRSPALRGTLLQPSFQSGPRAGVSDLMREGTTCSKPELTLSHFPGDVFHNDSGDLPSSRMRQMPALRKGTFAHQRPCLGRGELPSHSFSEIKPTRPFALAYIFSQWRRHGCQNLFPERSTILRSSCLSGLQHGDFPDSVHVLMYPKHDGLHGITGLHERPAFRTLAHLLEWLP